MRFHMVTEQNHFSPHDHLSLFLFRPFLLRRLQSSFLPPGISLFIQGFLKSHHIHGIILLIMALSFSQASELQRQGYQNAALSTYEFITEILLKPQNEILKWGWVGWWKNTYFPNILTTIFISTFSVCFPTHCWVSSTCL